MTSTAPRPVADRVLAVGALLGLVALLGVALGATLGVRPLFFRSGSMAPTIGTGSLALARHVPATDLRVGDVVSVRTASGQRVTHRVERIGPATGDAQVALTLRGDANQSPDAGQYVVGSAYRVFWHVPVAGYVVGTALSPIGLLALGVLAALLLLGGRAQPRPRGRHARHLESRHRVRKIGVTTAATAAAITGAAGSASASPWTDGVVVSSAYAAHTVLPPVSTTCSASSPTATITWPEKDARYDYEVQLKRADSSVVSTKQVTGTAVSQAYTATGDFGFTALALGTYDFTVEVRSYLAATTSWRSSTVLVATQKIRVTVVLVVVPVLGSISCV
ncbi:MAG TPA: signal peptidase I [Marmoricola sp.]|jgi:signal peptidase I|nr:signal peptidase I [Marmoricola sp.]